MNIRQLLFALLRAGLFEEKISDEAIAALSDAEVQKRLYTLSKKHDLAHVVGERLGALGIAKSSSDGGSAEDFQKEHLLAVMRYRRIEHELLRLCEIFENRKIRFMPLKGSVIREHYRKPWLRTSCDIDILVDPDVVDEAARMLVNELGYTEGEKGPHDVGLFSESGIHVELHYSLIEDSLFPAAADLLDSVWAHSSPVKEGSYKYILSDEMYYFYHVAHMAKHYLNGGCGIRPFIDLYILDTVADKNKDNRDALIEKGGLSKFVEAAKALSAYWLCGGTAEPLVLQMEEFIFSGGTYGNLSNNVAVEQARRGGKLGYVFHKIFIPYDVIKYRYPVLQTRKWLLPFCQVRRWFEILFCGGAKRSLAALKENSSISSSEAASVQNMLESLGLSETL